jgi:hypothetical protein
MTKKAAEKLYESKHACVVTRRDDGHDEVTFCTVMEWMLDADKRTFRVGNFFGSATEGSRLGVVIDLAARRFRECVFCPFCGVKIQTRLHDVRGGLGESA